MDEQSFESLMQQQNDEQRAIYDDIIYCKQNFPYELLQLFLLGITRTWKTFTLKVIVQGLFRIYNQELNFDPLKIKD